MLGIIGVLVGAGATLLGVWLGPLGPRLTAKHVREREERERRYRFIERQLTDFYAPMVGIRNDIRCKSELRVRVATAADEVWRNLCAGKSVEQLQELEKSRFPAFKRIVDYDSEQLRAELLPGYRRILEIFKQGYWLAEESTKKHYPKLVEFVELWNRSLDESLPWEVVEKLGHSEASLSGFYVETENVLKELRDKLASGAVQPSRPLQQPSQMRSTRWTPRRARRSPSRWCCRSCVIMILPPRGWVRRKAGLVPGGGSDHLWAAINRTPGLPYISTLHPP
jgi:hypothetical protein